MNRLQLACSLLVPAAFGLIASPAPDRGSAADAGKIAGHFDRSKTTLAKLVSAAEQHSKGRAVAALAELPARDDAALHVYCVAGEPPKIMKCSVDPATATVKVMKEVHGFPVAASPEGSDHGSGVKLINGQTMELACGACIYSMPGVEGCPLAIKIDGTPYLVEGATWPNHDYCDRTCQALVSGRLEGGKFIATALTPTK